MLTRTRAPVYLGASIPRPEHLLQCVTVYQCTSVPVYQCTSVPVAVRTCVLAERRLSGGHGVHLDDVVAVQLRVPVALIQQGGAHPEGVALHPLRLGRQRETVMEKRSRSSQYSCTNMFGWPWILCGTSVLCYSVSGE